MNIVFYLAVFFNSALGMVFEIASGRLVAFFTGQSVYSWASVIGVFLGFCAIGNFAGGKLADKYSARKLVIPVFLITSLLILFTPVLNNIAGSSGIFRSFPFSTRVFLHILIVVSLPSIMFGTTSVILTRHLIFISERKEFTFGLIYSLGSVACISGALLTGFVLVPSIGTTAIFNISGAVMFFIFLLLFLIFRKHREKTDGKIQELPEPAKFAKIDFKIIAVPAMICFFAGLSFMVLEMSGARMLSEEFGQSIFVWSAVMTTMLAAAAAGNVSGAFLAEKFDSAKLLILAMPITSAMFLLVPILRNKLFFFEMLSYGGLPLRISLYSAVILCAPSFFSGVVISTAAARPVKVSGNSAGTYSGIIFAAVSLGSIVGTLLVPFVLLGNFGVVKTVLIAGSIFVFFPPAVLPRKALSYVPAALFAALSLAVFLGGGRLAPLICELGVMPQKDPLTIYRAESPYSLIRIQNDSYDKNLRRFYIDRLQHSEANAEDPLDLRYYYEKIYAEVLMQELKLEKSPEILVLGGGGFTFPRWIELSFEKPKLSVAEIDPAVTDAAFKAFGLPEDTGMKIYDVDGGIFVSDLASDENSLGKFDVIIGDAVNYLVVPFHLTSESFMAKVGKLLRKNEGIYMMTVIDILDHGKFLKSIVKTADKAFKHVYVISTHCDKFRRDTFVVICSDKKLELGNIPVILSENIPTFSGRLWTSEEIIKELEGKYGTVLTDDFAPIEELMKELIINDTEYFAQKSLKKAAALRKKGRFSEAAAECDRALENRPGWFAAHHEKGINFAAAGRLEDAIREFRKSCELRPDFVFLRESLCRALMQKKDWGAAIEEFQTALNYEPKNTELRIRLAEAFYKAGMEEESKLEWLRAAEK